MVRLLFLIIICSTISCTQTTKEPSEIIKFPEANSHNQTRFVEAERSDWLNYKEDLYSGFTLKFKYPSNLVADTIENCRCIGKRTKPESPNEPFGNTMDFSIWLEDVGDSSIEEDLYYTRKVFNATFVELRDSVLIANKKTLRVRYFDKGNNKLLQENLYLQKFGILFSIQNKALAKDDFEYFLKSIEVEKK